MQGMQNVETINSITRAEPLKIVATCPHCFNTLANEYPQLGGNYEVVHPHATAGAGWCPEGKLVPVEAVDKSITYHDPCYLGRHNKVYTPPREVLGVIPELKSTEMHRCKERGFCLRRRRRALLDGGEDRQAGERRAHRRGAGPGPRRHLHRVPVLHGDAVRRGSRQRSARARPAKTSRSSTWLSCSSSRSAGRRRRSPTPTRPPSPPRPRPPRRSPAVPPPHRAPAAHPPQESAPLAPALSCSTPRCTAPAAHAPLESARARGCDVGLPFCGSARTSRS